jgi:hypothetical protein
VAIRASGNVSSITDNGTGLYTLNFRVAMPDANYAIAGIGPTINGTNGASLQLHPASTPPQAGSLLIATQVNNVLTDQAYMTVSIFR